MALPPILSQKDCYELLMKAWKPMKERGRHVFCRAWPKDGSFEEPEAVVIVARGQAATMLWDFVRNEIPEYDGE